MDSEYKIRVAINGYGRIGRSILRALYELNNNHINRSIEIVAINELANAESIVHLTRYDSTHGRFNESMELQSDQLVIADKAIQLIHELDMRKLPWEDLQVDIVLECTGTFSDRKTAQIHLEQGAKLVIFSQPAESDVDATIVYGVNHEQLLLEHKIISNASCTTNAAIPLLHVIQNSLGIDVASIRTLHSVMQDQPVIDAYHHTNLLKTRAAWHSMIPVATSLAKGIERFMPELQNRVKTQAMRIPIINVSALDIAIVLQKKSTLEEVQTLLQQASKGMCGIMSCSRELLVSCDFNHNTYSAIIDFNQTWVTGGNFLNTFIWFDNEWGYANRMLDLTIYCGQMHAKDWGKLNVKPYN